MKLKNIIFYFPNFSEGGIESVSYKLANYFNSKNINIYFISYKIPKSKNFVYKKKIKLINFKNQNVGWLIKNFSCLKLLLQILFKKDKKNTVILALSNLHLCIILSKILGFNVVSRNSAPVDYFKPSPTFFDLIKFYIKGLVYSFSDLIIANSKISAAKIKKMLFLRTKVVSILNPFIMPIKYNTPKKTNTILYVGRLSSEKGVTQLVKGFEIFQKKYKNYKLNIVGDGGQKKIIKEYIQRKKLNEKVVLLGWINNVNKYYLNSKVLILPSFFEGFGNVLIEALSFKLPCISTKTDGPKEVLKNGRYGLLIKNNEPKNISNGIIELIKNYKIYTQKAKLGYKENTKYDFNSIGHKYLKNINSVLN